MIFLVQKDREGRLAKNPKENGPGEHPSKTKAKKENNASVNTLIALTANEAALADRKNNNKEAEKNRQKGNQKIQNKTGEAAVKILGIQGQRLAKILDAVNQNKPRQNPTLENLAKTLRKLLEELKKFNQSVEKNRLEANGGDKKIQEGRVLPPILRRWESSQMRGFETLFTLTNFF